MQPHHLVEMDLAHESRLVPVMGLKVGVIFDALGQLEVLVNSRGIQHAVVVDPVPAPF
mgnify:CR=1 FL=1